MKMMILSLTWMMAPAAHALLWTELDPGSRYAMVSGVKLKPDLKLSAGTRMKLLRRTDLDQLRVYVYEFALEHCPGSLMNQRSDIVIVQELYGVELEPRCRINQYVEYRDTGRESLVRGVRTGR